MEGRAVLNSDLFGLKSERTKPSGLTEADHTMGYLLMGEHCEHIVKLVNTVKGIWRKIGKQLVQQSYKQSYLVSSL